MLILNAKDFGIFIKITRKKAKLTQSQLAAASGIGERFLRELEKALLVARMLGIKIEITTPFSIT